MPVQVDVLVVGAGFAGAVCARELADCGRRVRVIERRDHIGGNAFDCLDGHGVRIHPYGPHIFHTNSQRVFDHLSRFTDWRFYEHRVTARIDGIDYPIPINRTTINRLYGLDLDPAGIADWLARVRVDRPVANAEDQVLAQVGPDLCDRFFRGYSRKHWGLDLTELAPSVTARIPVRTTDDDRYFTDRLQYMPADGYSALFDEMLRHPRIDVVLGCDYLDRRQSHGERHLIFTGPIDAWFDHRLGRLPYRSVRFEHEHLPGTERFQSTGTVNCPGPEPFTRITEFKHLTGQRHGGTSLMREYPTAEGEPFYPVPNPANAELYRRYRALADALPAVTFLGRLAQYRYWNMDQAVAAALAVADRLLDRRVGAALAPG
ncbi:MAG: UDP-galactopyranose mutase [Alphaproteobacteria bacterium]